MNYKQPRESQEIEQQRDRASACRRSSSKRLLSSESEVIGNTRLCTRQSVSKIDLNMRELLMPTLDNSKKGLRTAVATKMSCSESSHRL